MRLKNVGNRICFASVFLSSNVTIVASSGSRRRHTRLSGGAVLSGGSDDSDTHKFPSFLLTSHPSHITTPQSFVETGMADQNPKLKYGDAWEQKFDEIVTQWMGPDGKYDCPPVATERVNAFQVPVGQSHGEELSSHVFQRHS